MPFYLMAMQAWQRHFWRIIESENSLQISTIRKLHKRNTPPDMIRPELIALHPGGAVACMELPVGKRYFMCPRIIIYTLVNLIRRRTVYKLAL